jgi:phosphomevalonate kinase
MAREWSLETETSIEVTAPGKVVLWGEYAVLAGAPAAVMAVNRHAVVKLARIAAGWQFTSLGFLTPGLHTWSAAFNGIPATALLEAALTHWNYPAYPQPMAVITDTRAFYHGGEKLGLGSSAAACVATVYALARCLDRHADPTTAIGVHRRLQGRNGSGLDVVTSVQGGVLRFQDGAGTALAWPQNLLWRVVWTGTSASTSDHLKHFVTWRANTRSDALQRLADASEVLCGRPDVDTLKAYVAQLEEFDAEAGLNIFGQEHQRLATIAARYDLIYKPCGAGGGDIGIAFGTDASALDAFQAAAAAAHFVPLDLEIAIHGVEICV